MTPTGCKVQLVFRPLEGSLLLVSYLKQCKRHTPRLRKHNAVRAVATNTNSSENKNPNLLNTAHSKTEKYQKDKRRGIKHEEAVRKHTHKTSLQQLEYQIQKKLKCLHSLCSRQLQCLVGIFFFYLSLSLKSAGENRQEKQPYKHCLTKGFFFLFPWVSH